MMIHKLPILLALVMGLGGPVFLPSVLGAEGLPTEILMRAQKGDQQAQYLVGHAYEQGNGVARDVTLAVEWYTKAAGSGQPEAQYRLGLLYYGYALSRDYSKAEKWFRKAISKGHTGAEFHLGLMYEYGYGLPQNYKEATLWYRKAALKNHVEAQTNLAWMYFKGLGIPQDDLEAYKWYLKAAENGNALGQYFLGRMHQEGRGAPKDPIMAHMWFNLAAANAKRHLRHQAVQSREDVASAMSSEQILEAQRLAKIWYEKNASQP